MVDGNTCGEGAFHELRHAIILKEAEPSAPRITWSPTDAHTVDLQRPNSAWYEGPVCF